MTPNVTKMTSSMLVMAEVLSERMGKTPVGRSRRVLKVTAPMGPSSAGGEVARQSLVLSSGNEQPVCGWVDFVALVAEIKDYETTRQAHEARYRNTFDVSEAEYRVMLSNAQAVLNELGVRTSVVGSSDNYAPTDPSFGNTAPGRMVMSGPQRSSALPLLVGVLLMLIVLGGVFAVFFF